MGVVAVEVAAYREADRVPQLLAAAEALWQDQVVEVRYRRWSRRPGS
ncbi:hypothetical protein [Amycolatopsis sp. CA-126428]|nr:hypothetical protein [Amycolatopsis sp. CA-126428]